jgi:hypothetical protein
MADGREMYPDLVGSARLQTEFNEAELTVSLQSLPVRPGLSSFSGTGRHFFPIQRVPPHGRVDLSLIRNGAEDNADILSRRRVSLELLG